MADHRASAPAAERSLSTAHDISGATGRLGVLLIEDDDDDALIVEDLLADGHGATVLARGRTLAEGLERLGEGIDCVLLDLRLPDVTGVEAVRQLRASAPGSAVIVLTGLDDEAAGQAAMSAGAQDYLVKGRVDGQLLARAIRYAVGRREAQEMLAQLQIAEVRAEETARLERGLVPHPMLSSSSVWVASRYLPERGRARIGGDFYDAVEGVDGAVHVLMGDVSGRGPDEAALGAGLRIAWRALTIAKTPGARIMPTLQAVIEAERQDPRTFATVCTLRIDPVARTLRVRRAGHLTPVLLGDRDVRALPLDGGGPPIGMFGSAEWPASDVVLPVTWSVLLYTDGLIEGRDGAGLLGEAGLLDILADRLAARPGWREAPGALLGDIVAEVRRRHGGPSSDDVALLAAGAR